MSGHGSGGGGDGCVGSVDEADEADGQVSQGGRDQRSVAGAQLVAVLARDHAPDPVEAVLNVPVVAGLGRDLLGAGLVHGQGADQVDDLGGLLLAAAALVDGAGAPDLDHLCGAGEVHPPGGLDDLEGAPPPPPVGAVGDGQGRDVLPGQVLEHLVQTGLVVLDRQQVVGAPGDDPLGRIHLGVHGVGGDQGPVQVQRGEQLGQGRDLIGLVGHPPLRHDDSADLVQGRQQVRRRVVRGAGPAHGLARRPRRAIRLLTQPPP